MEHLGQLAALTTAVCWAFTAMFFSAAGKRVGSMAVNLIRLVMAFAILVAFQFIVRGLALPTDATPHAWLWLGVSGLIGFAFGDLLLFRAFVVLGPRLSSLMMAMAPPLTAVIGYFVLGETLTGLDWLGMSLTVGGIAWAVSERPRGAVEKVTAAGVLLALGGALGQAGGLVVSKYGMGTYDPFAATQIRVLAGIAGFAVIFTLTGWWPKVVAATRHRTGMAYTAGGAVFGPFLGVSFSLLAVQHTEAGVAASIMATTPIIIIPVVFFVRKERVGIGGIAGAILAVAGVSLLFL